MRALVVGGSGSGKSVFAEGLACALSDRRTYVATMEDEGREAHDRIARHRAQRASLGFTTIECPCSLTSATEAMSRTGGVALVEDVGNLVANSLFSKDGRMADPRTVKRRLAQEAEELAHATEHMVVVGNLVGSEGYPGHEATLAWVRLVGGLCCLLASEFDVVVEVVMGVPHVVKGMLP